MLSTALCYYCLAVNKRHFPVIILYPTIALPFQIISFHSSYLYSSLTSLSALPLPAQGPLLSLLWPLGGLQYPGGLTERTPDLFVALVLSTATAFVHTWACHWAPGKRRWWLADLHSWPHFATISLHETCQSVWLSAYLQELSSPSLPSCLSIGYCIWKLSYTMHCSLLPWST